MPAAEVRLDVLPADGTLCHRLCLCRCCCPRRPLSPAAKGRRCAGRGFSSLSRRGPAGSRSGHRSQRVARYSLARLSPFSVSITIRVLARSTGVIYRWKCCHGRLWGHRGAVVGIAPSFSTPNRRSERRPPGSRLLAGRRSSGNTKRRRRRCRRFYGRGLCSPWPVSGRCSSACVYFQPAALRVEVLAAELDNHLHRGERIAWMNP